MIGMFSLFRSWSCGAQGYCVFEFQSAQNLPNAGQWLRRECLACYHMRRAGRQVWFILREELPKRFLALSCSRFRIASDMLHHADFRDGCGHLPFRLLRLDGQAARQIGGIPRSPSSREWTIVPGRRGVGNGRSGLAAPALGMARIRVDWTMWENRGERADRSEFRAA
jgi:hypothetical protein